MARLVRALALGKGDLVHASVIASDRWPLDTCAQVLKAAVSAGGPTDSDWAAPLAGYENLQADFLEALRSVGVVSRLASVRKIPFRVRVPRISTPSIVGWVGDGVPKPVSELRLIACNSALPKSQASSLLATS